MDAEYGGSAEFLEALADNGGVFTENFVDEHFDRMFRRTYNTQFLFNPHFRARFKEQSVEKPQCFLYVPDMYMKKYVFELADVAKEYGEQFEFVFTSKEKEAMKYFYTREFPDVFPYVVVIDKNGLLPEFQPEKEQA